MGYYGKPCPKCGAKMRLKARCCGRKRTSAICVKCRYRIELK